MDERRNRPDPKRSLVGFMLGGAQYALPITAVREVVNGSMTTPIPRAHPAVMGVTDHRGQVIPVIDLRSYLGFEPLEEGKKAQWILVEVNGRTIGLCVDRVTGVFGSEGALRPADVLPDETLGGMLGMASFAGKLILVLDPSSLESLVASFRPGDPSLMSSS